MYIFQCKDERKHRNDTHFLYLVFCHIALGFDDVLDACGHAVTQFLEVGNVHVQNPQLLDRGVGVRCSCTCRKASSSFDSRRFRSG